MPALANPKHEHFAQLITAGATPTKAYALTGYSENGAAQSAARLLRSAKVRARVSELQSAVAERAVEKAAVDKAWVLARLRENVERAMQAKPVLDTEGNPQHRFRLSGKEPPDINWLFPEWKARKKGLCPGWPGEVPYIDWLLVCRAAVRMNIRAVRQHVAG
jgi:hypothetical protein